jgi:hypothetical protein
LPVSLNESTWITTDSVMTTNRAPSRSNSVLASQ